MVVWAAFVAVAVIGVNSNRTTKMCNGGYLPMCVCAAMACTMIQTRLRQIKARIPRIAWSVMASTVVASMTLTCCGMLMYGFRTHQYESALHEVAGLIMQSADTPCPSVLTEPNTARMLCVLGPTRTYCGHYALTPDYAEKRRELQFAGVSSANQPLGENNTSASAFYALLQRAQVDYVVLHRNMPAYSFAMNAQQLTPVQEVDSWRIFKTTPSPQN